MARAWRNWAFESAALDLALRQAGLTLPAALDRPVAPVRFVNSLGLGDPPSAAGIARALRAEPHGRLQARRRRGLERGDRDRAGGAGLRRDGRLQGSLRARGRRRGRAGRDVPRRARGVPVGAAGGPARARRRRGAARAGARPRVLRRADPPRRRHRTTRTINVKPSRIGGLRPLLEIYEWCDANGVAMYGGGMGELGIGRGQIELLAALFHPDAPNDVAPVGVQRRGAGRRAAVEPARARRARRRASAGVTRRRPARRCGGGAGRAPRRRACRARRPGPRPRAAWRGRRVELAEPGSAIAARGAGADAQVLGDRAPQPQLGLVVAAERARQARRRSTAPSRGRCRRARRPGTAARSARASACRPRGRLAVAEDRRPPRPGRTPRAS